MVLFLPEAGMNPVCVLWFEGHQKRQPPPSLSTPMQRAFRVGHLGFVCLPAPSSFTCKSLLGWISCLPYLSQFLDFLRLYFAKFWDKDSESKEDRSQRKPDLPCN